MMHKFRPALVLLLIATSHSQTISDVHNLLAKFKSGYDRNVRPVVNQREPVVVYISFYLVAIQGLDEVSEKLSTVCLLSQRWVDPQITWNPSLYNGTYDVSVPITNVWKADFIIGNPMDNVFAFGKTDWMKIRYTFHGKAYWLPGDMLHCTCKVDLTYYPFDTQICRLKLVAWGYIVSEVKIHVTMDTADLTYFTENGEWELVRSSVDAELDNNDEYTTVNVWLWIKRRPVFLVVNVLLPIILLGVLNVLVFAMPVDSGERISFAMTVLLAITVFLTIVGDNMPKRSQPMSFLCYFLLMNLIVSALICGGTIYNLTIYHRDDLIPVPEMLARLTRKIVYLNSKRTTQSRDLVKGSDDSNGKQSNVDNVVQPRDSNENVSVPNKGNVFVETEDLPEVTWQHVSRMYDRIFGTIAIAWLLSTTVCFLILVSI